MKKRDILISVLAAACCVVTGCKVKTVRMKPVCCTIEEALPADSASQAVRDAMASLVVDDRYEKFYGGDLGVDISAYSLMRCTDDVSSEGMGIMIEKDGKATAFPDIRHGSYPNANYDGATQTLKLSAVVMEGTGVHVEQFYRFRFDEAGTASIVETINPYYVLQVLKERLFYSIDGHDISFYDRDSLICCVTDTVSDMGGFDEEPVWIGEQLRFGLWDTSLRVFCMPGLKYVTGLVLNYDAMPNFMADVAFDADGNIILGPITLSDKD